MDPQEKAVYVAVGTEREEGFKTLRWTLHKWKSQPISIIILHLDIAKDTVKTFFGTMPASSVSDEMLEVFRKKEQETIDNLLSQYIAFCGKVKAEIFKVKKYDKAISQLIIDLISGLHITNLVMGLTFMKSSSRKTKTAISGCFHIYQHKPEFCELFVVSGGKQILTREDGSAIDELPSSPSTTPKQWESYAEEIDNYFKHLLSLNCDEKECEQEQENNDDISHDSPMEAEMKEMKNSNVSVAEKSEFLKIRIKEVNEKIQSKRKEAEANAQSRAKAERAIYLCNRRAEELETLTAERAKKRWELRNELDATREFLREIITDVEESKKIMLQSVAEVQSELSEKLQSSSMAKSEAEVELRKAAAERAEMVGEIEELRRQRDVLRRRIEFCREKDTDDGGTITMGELRCELREFSSDEIRSATDNFSEQCRLKSGGDWSNVYKGRINLQTVAIKMVQSPNQLHNHMHHQDFHLKVKLLASIRHPHLIAMIGYCSELKCIVFEYAHNGSLRDVLFSSCRISSDGSQTLPWHTRIRVAAQVCSGLCYLHLARPKPIVHGHLTASNILLGRNLDARINGFGLSQCSNDSQVRSNVQAFGLLLMHLLTGRNWAGLVDEAMLIDRHALVRVLDKTAGEWPWDLVEGLALLAYRCSATNVGSNRDIRLEMLMEELNELKKKADVLADRRECEVRIDENRRDSCEVPSAFLCPIDKEVMENPHVAADGFSYELKAIEAWLGMGRDTSPMTNLKLKHKFLTPNRSLCALIQDWHN